MSHSHRIGNAVGRGWVEFERVRGQPGDEVESAGGRGHRRGSQAASRADRGELKFSKELSSRTDGPGDQEHGHPEPDDVPAEMGTTAIRSGW